MATFNIEDLYRQAFGHVAYPPFRPDRRPFEVNVPGDGTPPSNQLDPSQEFSYLGTPLIFPVELGGVRLPNEPLVSVRGGKKVIRTPIDGRKGTFKEEYSLQDYEVTIAGIAIDEENPDQYPFDQVRAIREVCERPGSVEVVCDLLTLFGIDRLAIEPFEFPADVGMGASQRYFIRAYSDNEFELELNR